MLSIRKTSTHLAATACFALIFGSAPSASAQTYTIRFNPKPGTIRYSVSSNTSGDAGPSGQTMSIQVEMLISMEVKNLPHGQHRLKVSYDKMHMVANGKSMDEMMKQRSGSSTTMIVDSKGKEVKVNGAGRAKKMAGGMGNMSDLGFFGKPLTVGKTFRGTGGMMGSAPMIMNYKLVGVSKVGGHRLANFEVLSVSGSGTMPAMKVIGKPETIVDMDNGMLVSMRMKLRMSSGPGSSTTDMTMKQVP